MRRQPGSRLHALVEESPALRFVRQFRAMLRQQALALAPDWVVPGASHLCQRPQSYMMMDVHRLRCCPSNQEK